MEIDPYNIITVLMYRDNDHSVKKNIEKAADMYHERQTRFLELLHELPTWNAATDSIAKKYVRGLSDWVGGNYYWQFECQRYFGSSGKQVYESGMVAWLPKFDPAVGER